MMKDIAKLNRTVGRSMGLPCGKSAFVLGGACCTVLAFAWTCVLLAPSGWREAESFQWKFRMSLYNFGTYRNDEAMKSQQHHGVTKLSQLFDTLEQQDDIWIAVARYEFCQMGIDPEWCDYFHSLQIGCWCFIFFGFLGVCSLFMGAMTGFHYHFIKPREDILRWTTAYLVAAPVAFQLGFTVWYFTSKGLRELTAGENSGNTFGWMPYCAIILGTLTWITSWIMLNCAFRSSWDEELDDDDEEKLWAGSDSEGDYGATMFQNFTESIGASPLFSGAGDTEAATSGLESGAESPGAESPGAESPGSTRAKAQPTDSDVEVY